MKKNALLLLASFGIGCCLNNSALAQQTGKHADKNPATPIIEADSTGELLANSATCQYRGRKRYHIPPKKQLVRTHAPVPVQNLLALSFDDRFSHTKTDARVKRLRLRFDGYVYTPKLVYSIQLGFTGHDAEPLPNGNMNIVRDAIVYYVPSPKWNIGFGQTKIKANRARINSSSALQFVDRSIVNSEFNLDRDFGSSASTTSTAPKDSTSHSRAP